MNTQHEAIARALFETCPMFAVEEVARAIAEALQLSNEEADEFVFFARNGLN